MQNDVVFAMQAPTKDLQATQNTDLNKRTSASKRKKKNAKMNELALIPMMWEKILSAILLLKGLYKTNTIVLIHDIKHTIYS